MSRSANLAPQPALLVALVLCIEQKDVSYNPVDVLPMVHQAPTQYRCSFRSPASEGSDYMLSQARPTLAAVANGAKPCAASPIHLW